VSHSTLQNLFRPRPLKTMFALCVIVGFFQLLASGDGNSIAADQAQAPATTEKLPPATEITQNTTLDPEKVYGRLIIKASNITIDGRGAKIVGAKTGSAKQFQGIGILAEGVSNVTLTNVRVSGWETGLKIVNAEGWTVSDCDFSGNFHDPDFGWGEQGRRGGIVLERTSKSTLKKNKANQVWDACVLVNSNDNIVADNDFSQTSNTCLKLWTSCRNTFSKNVLSHGIRISPGEVHARDSTSVLIESGSNDNRLLNNDCTYGGDGIFVRVLNGWVSTGNHFEGNDCSYANNNGFECWAPRNVFIKNKANHCSYGFWMGGSDQTRLIDNEASFNGDLKGHHNSPHLPQAGHAGIVFMFGPGSHCVARGNTCVGNNGAGIAIIGDLDTKGQKWKAFHWIVEQNTLNKNRWGIYLNYADWIDVTANDLRENTQKDIFDAGGVTRLQTRSMGQAADELKRLRLLSPPIANLSGPHSATIGEVVEFDARASRDPASSELKFNWDLGDGTLDSANHVQHAFKTPGFHRLGLTVTNGTLSDLAWRDFYVVEDLPELATESQADQWGEVTEPNLKIAYHNDPATKLAGKSSVHAVIDPYHGQRASLLFPRNQPANWSLQGKTHLVFWLKTINPNLAWQDANPLVKLYSSESDGLSLTPQKDLLNQPSFNEAREGWKYFEIPLAGDKQWQREGTDVKTLHHLTIGVDSWDAQPLELWIDGLAFKTN
jgi:parallel beta-helix repeat protein